MDRARFFPKIITLWARQQIANADLLLTISDFQKQEIEAYIKKSALPLPPVRAIRLGDNAKLLSDKEPPLPRVVPQRPFILCVSTVDVRKNQLCLYHVLATLGAGDSDLLARNFSSSGCCMSMFPICCIRFVMIQP